MKVYYMLLEAFFKVGKDLEKKFPWVPQVRTQMVEGKTKDFVRKTTACYYLATTMAPLIGGVFFLWPALGRCGTVWDGVLTSALLVLACVILLVFYSTRKQSGQKS